jgi:FMN-dependent NADH-azoreductase
MKPNANANKKATAEKKAKEEAVKKTNAASSIVTQNVETKIDTFDGKYKLTTKLIQNIRNSILKNESAVDSTVDYSEFFNSVLKKIEEILDYYESAVVKLKNPPALYKSTDYNYSTFLKFPIGKSGETLGQISPTLLIGHLTDNKDNYIKYLSALIFRDYVKMFLDIIAFIVEHKDNYKLVYYKYSGYNTCVSNILKILNDDDTFLHTDTKMLMNSPEHRNSHLKFTALNYLLEAIQLINKCSENNLLDVFKIYENIEKNGQNSYQLLKQEFNSKIIDCFYNYTLYYFIKKNDENSKSVAEIICDFSDTFNKLSESQQNAIQLLAKKKDTEYIRIKSIDARNKKLIKTLICDTFTSAQLKFVCETSFTFDSPVIYQIDATSGESDDIQGLPKSTKHNYLRLKDKEQIQKIIGNLNTILINKISGGSKEEFDKKKEKENGIKLVREIMEKMAQKQQQMSQNLVSSLNAAFKEEPPKVEIIDNSLQKSLVPRLNVAFKEESPKVEIIDNSLQESLVPKLNQAFKEEPPKVEIIDNSLRDSLVPRLNGAFKEEPPKVEIVDNSLRDSLVPRLNEAFKNEPPKVEVIDNSLQDSLIPRLNGAFKEEPPKVEIIDDQLQRSLLSGLNEAFKNEPPKVEVIDNSLQESLVLNLNDLLNTNETEPIDNSLQNYLTINLNNALNIKKEKEEKEEDEMQYTDEDFIKLIIKNPTKDEDADIIIKMIQKINSQEPQEIDKIGNTHFHYIAGSFYEQKEAMFGAFYIYSEIRSFFNYQNAEGTTPLMILFSKCQNMEDLQKISIESVDDIEQEDIYGNSIFSILTKKIVEFSRKEIQIQNTSASLVAPLRGASSDFIEKIIQNNITSNTINQIPKITGPIDPLENTVLHYVAGSFLSMTEKIGIMNDEKFKDQLNYQNAEGATPLMILTKHMTKEDLDDDYIKNFIAENIADLEQEDIYGNSIFSILTKKMVEFSGEEKVEFQ